MWIAPGQEMDIEEIATRKNGTVSHRDGQRYIPFVNDVPNMKGLKTGKAHESIADMTIQKALQKQIARFEGKGGSVVIQSDPITVLGYQLPAPIIKYDTSTAVIEEGAWQTKDMRVSTGSNDIFKNNWVVLQIASTRECNKNDTDKYVARLVDQFVRVGIDAEMPKIEYNLGDELFAVSQSSPKDKADALEDLLRQKYGHLSTYGFFFIIAPADRNDGWRGAIFHVFDYKLQVLSKKVQCVQVQSAAAGGDVEAILLNVVHEMNATVEGNKNQTIDNFPEVFTEVPTMVVGLKVEYGCIFYDSQHGSDFLSLPGASRF